MVRTRYWHLEEANLQSTVSRSLHRSSTSGSVSPPTPPQRSCRHRVTSTCPSSKAPPTPCSGTTCSSGPKPARPRRRHDPRERAHRDRRRCVRHGRDPLRSADHITALHAGNWDYLFSMIKTFAADPEMVLPIVTRSAPRPVHPGVHRTPRLHMSPPRCPRHRRHVRRHPRRTRPGSNRPDGPQGHRRQASRSRRWIRRHRIGHPPSSRSRPPSSTAS